MVIDEEVLLGNGGEVQIYGAKESILLDGSLPKFYFQIISGIVKLNTYRDDGSEIIYSLPSEGHCFAETFLWHETPYCINAVAITEAKIIKLPKPDFMHLINSNSSLLNNVMAYTAERMFYRYKMLDLLSTSSSAKRILGVLHFLKNHDKVEEPFMYIVPFSRQQIADITGLRLETVVRTVKKLEQENHLCILNGKICL